MRRSISVQACDSDGSNGKEVNVNIVVVFLTENLFSLPDCGGSLCGI